MTQVLLDVSHWSQQWWPLVLIGTVALCIAAVALYRFPPARMAIDRWILRLPLLGKVLRLAGTVSLARNLAMLLASGVPLLEALRTIERSLPNSHLAGIVARARQAVLA